MPNWKKIEEDREYKRYLQQRKGRPPKKCKYCKKEYKMTWGYRDKEFCSEKCRNMPYRPTAKRKSDPIPKMENVKNPITNYFKKKEKK